MFSAGPVYMSHRSDLKRNDLNSIQFCRGDVTDFKERRSGGANLSRKVMQM